MFFFGVFFFGVLFFGVLFFICIMFFALSYLSYLILGKTFVDWKRVFVKAGNGGNGSISFVHSRYNTFLYILESLTFTSEYIVMYVW